VRCLAHILNLACKDALSILEQQSIENGQLGSQGSDQASSEDFVDSSDDEGDDNENEGNKMTVLTKVSKPNLYLYVKDSYHILKLFIYLNS